MFGLDPKAKTVLVSGGSRGARSINRAMVGVLAHYAGRDGVQILHVTGKAGYDETMQSLKEAGVDLDAAGNLFVEPYLYNMPQALACADVAVFRAGAIGIAELTARDVVQRVHGGIALQERPAAARNAASGSPFQERISRNREKKMAWRLLPSDVKADCPALCRAMNTNAKK